MSSDPAPSDVTVPPGQQVKDRLPVKHYGPIPRADDPPSWAMVFGGSTADGEIHRLTVGELDTMAQTRVIADLHCASRWTVQGNRWDGVLAADLLALFPPAPGIEDVISTDPGAVSGRSAAITFAATRGSKSATPTRRLILAGSPRTTRYRHGSPVATATINDRSFLHRWRRSPRAVNMLLAAAAVGLSTDSWIH